jgi:hypothetical protein
MPVRFASIRKPTARSSPCNDVTTAARAPRSSRYGASSGSNGALRENGRRRPPGVRARRRRRAVDRLEHVRGVLLGDPDADGRDPLLRAEEDDLGELGAEGLPGAVEQGAERLGHLGGGQEGPVRLVEELELLPALAFLREGAVGGVDHRDGDRDDASASGRSMRMSASRSASRCSSA